MEESALIINQARRRYTNHNSARDYVRDSVFEALAASARSGEINPTKLKNDLKDTLEIRETLDWMWPSLTAEHFLHDLYGSKALLRRAGTQSFTEEEILLLHRERTEHASKVLWTEHDAPVLDEAQAIQDLVLHLKKKKQFVHLDTLSLTKHKIFPLCNYEC